jgi:hypothetical protein
MDVRAFAEELLRALAETGLFERVALQTEGPIASGYAYVQEDLYLSTSMRLPAPWPSP